MFPVVSRNGSRHLAHVKPALGVPCWVGLLHGHLEASVCRVCPHPGPQSCLRSVGEAGGGPGHQPPLGTGLTLPAASSRLCHSGPCIYFYEGRVTVRAMQSKTGDQCLRNCQN